MNTIHKGFTLWPIVPLFGGDSDAKEEKSDTASQNTGNSDSSGSSSGNSTNDDKGTSSSGTESKEKEADTTEFDGLTAKELRELLRESQAKRKEADSQLTEINRRLDEKERKERSDLENFKADVEKLTKENEQLKAGLERTAVINAIIQNKKFTFHDANDVMNNLNMDELKIDAKTTKVEGIETEIARVAKEKPFLVLKSSKDDEKNQNQNQPSGQQGQNSGSNGPTGFQPGQGGSKSNIQAETRNNLLSKYPILANR